MSFPDATAIHQGLLDLSGAALLDRDFAAFRDIFALPTEIETFENRIVISTEAALQAFFERVVGHHAETGVVDIVRRCLTADFKDNTTIWATHETRYLHHNNILRAEPHAVFSVLERQPPGSWKVTRSHYATASESPVDSALGRIAPNPRRSKSPDGGVSPERFFPDVGKGKNL